MRTTFGDVKWTPHARHGAHECDSAVVVRACVCECRGGPDPELAPSQHRDWLPGPALLWETASMLLYAQ